MLMNLDVLEKPQQQYKVGDIITENIPFVSFDNLTKEGFLLYHKAKLEAKKQGDDALKFRIKKSVRQSKKNSEIKKTFIPDLINAFREFGHVYYDDTITELEVFPWTFLTK